MTSDKKQKLTGLEVAVIGMAGRFPNSPDLEAFWENLRDGVECISFFTNEELSASHIDASDYGHPNYVKARGVLQGIEYFDASFFGFIPAEAEIMDPQTRIFHECSWEALENAGYFPETTKGRIGMFAGAASHLPWEVLSFTSGKAGALGQFDAWQLYDKDFMGTRVAYNLNLSGPAVNIYTACSTSLVAIHMACQGLLSGECRMALAGGITAAIPGKQGYTYQDGMIASPDGHCRTFDAKAGGTVFAEGVGIVVLKLLERAKKDGDFIHAVIKGSAVNNDGKSKVGYTAPSVKGQAAVIRGAMRLAGVKPESITYIETHGTATNLGDPAEIEGLKQAFKSQKKGFCRIGSVKSNLGHTDVAAGAAGFIKTVLALKHRLLPPSLHVMNPNPKLALDSSPFRVNTALVKWESNGSPLRAGVSSFGVGGTNAHIILEEAPPVRQSSASRPWLLLCSSGLSQDAAAKAEENLLAYLAENPRIPTADAAYTMQTGRKHHERRRLLVLQEDQRPSPDLLSSAIKGRANQPKIVFMFSGQGSQYVNMGRDLYRTEPVFREELDRCLEILDRVMETDVKAVLFSGDNETGSRNNEEINHTRFTQPLLFAVEYAMAKLLMFWGIQPYAMTGHSIGEYVAACLAAVCSLEDALALVALRGKLMQDMPGGAMMSAALPAVEIEKRLAQFPGLSLAAENSPGQSVVSGTFQAIEALEQQLKQDEIQCRVLHTSHAFHSSMMEPVLAPFQAAVAKISLNTPQIPYISNVTGDWITVPDALSSDYWARHLRRAVRFGDGMGRLMETRELLLIEVGPGKALSTFARQHNAKTGSHVIVQTIRHPRTQMDDQRFLLEALGRMWLAGATIDWKNFYIEEKRNRVPLPTYPFERLYFPIAGDPFKLGAEMIKKQKYASIKRHPDMSQWFYLPSWEQVPLPPAIEQKQSTNDEDHWLIFSPGDSTGDGIREYLEKKGPSPSIVKAGTGFSFEAGIFTIDPAVPSHYQRLFEELNRSGKKPVHIIHQWCYRGTPSLESHLERGYYSLLNIARAMGKLGLNHGVNLLTVVQGLADVTGDESIQPLHATLMGPVKTIPREYPNIRCAILDAGAGGAGTDGEAGLSPWTECLYNLPGPVVAYRDFVRWEQSIEPYALREHVASEETLNTLLKPEGVYLVTGGLGGIGLTLALYLAETYKARLILTGRTPLPNRREWQRWLASHDEHDPVSRKIQQLLRIQTLGGQFLTSSADAGDETAMKTLVRDARARFGKIDGIIHAAGVPDAGVIQVRTPEISETVFRSKIHGSLALDAIISDQCADDPPAFVMLCSSLAAHIGPAGQVAYASANAFMDALALSRSSSATRWLSVDWDSWRAVGMAVEAVRHMLSGASGQQVGDEHFTGTGAAIDVQHPLLDYRLDGQNQIVYVTRFSVDRFWVLDEHRVMGLPTLPGTALVEMALAAFKDYTQTQTMEIRDLYFMTPFRIPEGQEREVRTILTPLDEPGHYKFVIKSPGQAGEHVVGELAPMAAASGSNLSPKVHDIQALLAQCGDDTIVPEVQDEETRKTHGELGFIFGPRWQSVERVHFGPDCVLIEMRLPEAFSEDIGSYLLHPGMLDGAVGYFAGKDVKVEASLPFSYHRIAFKTPMTRKFYSFQRYEDRKAAGKLIKYDILLLDENGMEIAVIEDYKRLAVSGQAKERMNAEGGQPLSLSEYAGYAGSGAEFKEKEAKVIGHGLLPAEGVDVFRRVLGGAVRAGLSRVLVSTRDFPLLLEALTFQESMQASGGEQETPSGPLRARPDLSRDYTPPASETEKKLAAIWGNFLGVEQVGIHDDFFELGGDSLKIMTIGAKIHKALDVEVPLAEFFNSPTVAGIARFIDGAGKVKYSGIQPVEKKEYYPLSSAQNRLYFMNRIAPDNTVYNLPEFFVVRREDFHRDKVETAFRGIIQRHESLRTSFTMVAGEPVQRIADAICFQLKYIDLSDAGHSLNQRKREIQEEFIRPFDLEQAPLLRAGLLRLPDGSHICMVDMHHIIADGASLTILIEDFTALYNHRDLPPLRIQYKDFSIWQNRLFSDEQGVVKNQERYWLELFSDAAGIPRLNLPADFQRPEIFNFTGGHYDFQLDKSIAVPFKQLGAEHGATLYMNILAALNVLFYKYTGQNDIIIGSGIAGRPHADLQPILGMFVNTLAMRNHPSAGISYTDLLKETTARSVRAFENQDVQFEDLVEKLGVERDPSRNPLFDISMVVQTIVKTGDQEQGKPGSLTFEYQNDTTKYDITFFIYDLDETIFINVEYYTAIFKAETIQRLTGHFKNVVRMIAENPSMSLRDIDLITREEKRLVLEQFNRTERIRGNAVGMTVNRLFQEMAGRFPKRTAVIDASLGGDGGSLSYGELDSRSNQVARYLYESKNIRAHDEARIGVLMSNPLELAVALFGILKAGGAYVPIDPNLPFDRIKYMIGDAGAGILLSEKKYVPQLSRMQWECDNFHTYLCMDSGDLYGERELLDNDHLRMNRELWHHVGENTGEKDDIGAGGWLSSYTGLPFSAEEMDEYARNILEKLQPLLNPGMKVLEIGCASGFSMYRIAPHVKLYYGTDLSGAIIEKNRRKVREQGIANIKLKALAAHQIKETGERGFHLVILNSVIQCFHSHHYLERVIRQAIDLMDDHGYLFIGDIMDQDLKEDLADAMTRFKYDPANRDKEYSTKTDFSTELFVSRRFFSDLENRWTEIKDIQFSRKIHTIENELTRFRFDAVVTIDKTERRENGTTARIKHQDDLNVLEAFSGRPLPGADLAAPDTPAYIIYTSGTTGVPKGVIVEHRGVVNTLLFRKEEYGFDNKTVALQLFSNSFDGFVTSFFTPLVSGGAVVLLKREELSDTDRIGDAIARYGVTHFICVPPLYSAILNAINAEKLASLTTVTLAGDRINPGLLGASRSKLPDLEIVNEYGITECSVMSTIYRRQERDPIIKIGAPISNTQLYILDDQQRPLPIGVAGELHIAGTGLARGYLNNPELTNSKFHPPCSQRDTAAESPLERGGPRSGGVCRNRAGRLYKTGDLARWHADGNIELLGRMTYQVKVRGFRIEMQEIETRLCSHRFVREAVVVDKQRSGGETYLCAYLTLDEEAGGQVELEEIKTHLSGFLPAYMIPAHMMVLESLPLTAHGKIDRKSLPAPSLSGADDNGAVLAPGNRTQERLLDIWADVLGLERSAIGIDANFFDLGGHSLSLIKMNVKIKETFEKNIPVANLFRLTTIQLLASYLDEEQIDLQVSDEMLDESVNTMDETLNLLMEDDE